MCREKSDNIFEILYKKVQKTIEFYLIGTFIKKKKKNIFLFFIHLLFYTNTYKIM